MKKTLLIIFGLCLFGTTSDLVYAQCRDSVSQRVWQDIKQKTEKIQSLYVLEVAQFFHNENNIGSSYRATWAKKPNFSRTETNSLEENSVLLLDGLNLWYYNLDRNVIEKHTYDTTQVLTFFSLDNIHKQLRGLQGRLEYTRTDVLDGEEVYVFTSKGTFGSDPGSDASGPLQEADAWVDYYFRVKDGLDAKYILYDGLGRVMRIVEYLDYQVDIDIPPETFAMQIPSGIRVVDVE